MCSATRRVGNGTKAMHISRPRLATMNRRSTLPICCMTWWWFSHMIPIVTKLTAYARYDGHACERFAGSWTAPSTLRISSVAAIAKTPSAKVSSRAIRLARTGGDRLVRHPEEYGLLRRAHVLRLPAVEHSPVREPERVRRTGAAARHGVEEGRIAAGEARVRAARQFAPALALEHRDEAGVGAEAVRRAGELEVE